MSYKVYLYTFPDGKRYVGMTKLTLRERRNVGYQHNEPLRKVIRELKWNEYKHEILCDGLTEEEACEKEKEYIKLFGTTDPEKGYNISFGGKSTFAGLHHTKEHRERISRLYRGRHFSEEHLKHLREAHKKLCKPVLCLDSNKGVIREYRSLNEAARAVNGHPTNVNRACVSGRIYQYFFWRFADERG